MVPRPIRISRQRYGDANPDLGPVRAQVALLDKEGNTVSNKALAQRDICFPIVGMSYVGHSQGQKFIRRTADDLAIPLVDEEEATVQFALNDADRGLLEDAGEPLLAGAKRLLRPNSARCLDNCNQHTANTGQRSFVGYWAVTKGKAA